MATSTYQAAVLLAATSRNYSPSKSPLHQTRRCARFECVGIGGVVEHYFDLGSLALPGCRVIPEECKLRFTGTGTIDAKFTLKKANDAGTVVDLSAATATISALTAAIALAKPSGTLDTVALGETDMLRLYVTDGAGSDAVVPTTASVIVEVVYDVE